MVTRMSAQRARYMRFLGIPVSYSVKPLGTPSWKRSTNYTVRFPTLHAPLMPPCSDDFVRDMIKDPWVRPDEKVALRYLFDIRMYPACDAVIVHWPMSKILPEDDDLLDEVDLLKPCKNHEFTGYFGYLFTVDEEVKERRRLVHDTLTPNVLCDDPWDMGFTPINKLRRSVYNGEACATFDVKCMYYHFLLGDDVSELCFRVLTQSGMKRFTRLPMGFKWATKVAQAAIRYLCKGIINVSIELYIDNIMFIGTPANVAFARQQFLRRCETYHFKLGEDSGVSTIGTHRGIVFDFKRKSVYLSPSFITKLAHRLTVQDGSWTDYRALLSSAIYAATALAIPLAGAYHVLKWLAHHNATDGQQKVTMWDQTRRQWNALVATILLNQPFRPCAAQCVIGIVTDAATETGCGGAIMIFPSGTFKIVSFKINDYHSINDMEAAALSIALDRFKDHLSQRHIIYWGDNTSVLYTLQSGHSKSFHLNHCILTIIEQLQGLQSWLTPVYVPSASNPADAPSRLAPLSREHMSFLHRAAKILRVEQRPVSRRRGVD